MTPIKSQPFPKSNLFFFLVFWFLTASVVFPVGLFSQKSDPQKPSSFEPNELGKIPIFTYHKLGNEDTEYTRTISGFREDLERFFQEGFYPISVRDFANGQFSVPKGKRPIVLTFDDSSIYHFEYTKDGKIHPDSAVGIMEAFKKKHPGYPIPAMFFVNPGAKQPNNLFGQPEFTKQKLDFLVQNGYEIGNHTHWHANLKKYNKLIEEQIAKCQNDVVAFLPNYKMYALALPFGIFPKEEDRHRLAKGSYKNTNYENTHIFDYSNRLSNSPYSHDFDPKMIKRIHANLKGVDRAIKELNKPGMAFVSDGDPDTITIPSKNKATLKPSKGKKIVEL